MIVTILTVGTRVYIFGNMSQLHKTCEGGNTLLHIAAGMNSTAALSDLLAHQQCNPNVKNDKGDTPLHIAVRENKMFAISQLLAHEQSDPNAQNMVGDTPLHIAVIENKRAAISKLLAHKNCNPNAQNKKGDTPLHIAVIDNKRAATSILLAHKNCNPNAQNNEGDTPLHIACCSNLPKVIRFRLERRRNTNVPSKKGDTAQEIPLNEDGDCLLDLACQWVDVDIIRYLITDQRCDPNIGNSCMDTPLHSAVKHYQTGETIVQLLCSGKCNPNLCNREGDTPLHIAVRRNKTAAISHLLYHKQCSPNVQNMKGDTPLHIAVMDNQTTTISKLLVHKHCNPNVQDRQGDTPLHNACRSNFSNAIRLLLERKCSTNIPNNKGETAQEVPLNEDGDCLLHIACQWGDMDIIWYLITKQLQNSNPNIANSSGNTPLHTAVKCGHLHVAILLLSREECDVNIPDESGNTPLHLACHNKALSIVKLLERKCSTNIRNKKGEIAQEFPLNKDGDCLLHLACRWGDVGIVKYLITDQSCNPNIRNFWMNTPLHIAVKQHYQTDKIIDQLLFNFCSLQITIHHQSQIGYNCGNGVGAVHYLQSASGESLGSPRT